MPIDRVSTQTPVVSVRLTTLDGAKMSLTNKELGGDITNLTVTKTISATHGTFNFTMVENKSTLRSFVRKLWGDLGSGAFPWYRVFYPPALVDIYIDGQEQMLGIITEVTRAVAVGGGRVYKISGVDMGYVLTILSMIWDKTGHEGAWLVDGLFPWLPQDLQDIQVGLGAGQAADTVSPAEAMADRYSKWLAFIYDSLPFAYQFADGEAMQDKLRVISAPDGGCLSKNIYGTELEFGKEMMLSEQNFMAYFKSFVNYPFNELFVDCGDREVFLWSKRAQSLSAPNAVATMGFSPTGRTDLGQPEKVFIPSGQAHLIMRPSPFDDTRLPDGIYGHSLLRVQDIFGVLEKAKEPWQQEFFVIEEADVQNKSLGFSSQMQYSSYSVNFSAKFLGMPGNWNLAPPEYDTNAIAVYGHKPLVAPIETIDYTKMGNETDPLQPSYVSWLQKKLKSWFGMNDRLMRGSMTIKGNPFVRVGKFAAYKAEEEPFERRTFYVEGYTQTYNYGKSFTTSLQLTRGTPTSKILARNVLTRDVPSVNIGRLGVADLVEEARLRRIEESTRLEKAGEAKAKNVTADDV